GETAPAAAGSTDRSPGGPVTDPSCHRSPGEPAQSRGRGVAAGVGQGNPGSPADARGQRSATALALRPGVLPPLSLALYRPILVPPRRGIADGDDVIQVHPRRPHPEAAAGGDVHVDPVLPPDRHHLALKAAPAGRGRELVSLPHLQEGTRRAAAGLLDR